MPTGHADPAVARGDPITTGWRALGWPRLRAKVFPVEICFLRPALRKGSGVGREADGLTALACGFGTLDELFESPLPSVDASRVHRPFQGESLRR
jgi:hypothetical protein